MTIKEHFSVYSCKYEFLPVLSHLLSLTTTLKIPRLSLGQDMLFILFHIWNTLQQKSTCLQDTCQMGNGFTVR